VLEARPEERIETRCVEGVLHRAEVTSET
jgi:hypothetical protein